MKEAINEYAKLMTWFINEYPNETIELELRRKADGKVDFLLIFSDGDNKYSNAQYIEQSWTSSQLYDDVCRQILPKGKSAISAKLNRIRVL